MFEKIYLASIIVFFILAFAIRNIKTYLATRQSIKGKSLKLSLSIALSTVIYLLILLRIMLLKPYWIMEVNVQNFMIIKLIGHFFILLGFIIGIHALLTLNNSWRVGIKHDQKTELVTTGIYRLSRNPYFLSYDILIFGYILIFPSIVLFMTYLILVVIFHKMILEEDNYLESVHSKNYLAYKSKVDRYLTLKP